MSEELPRATEEGPNFIIMAKLSSEVTAQELPDASGRYGILVDKLQETSAISPIS